MRPPFSWLCHQEPFPWFGDQINGNVIPLHAHGHNRPTRDETPYPSTSTLSVYVNVPPRLRDGGTWVRGDAQGGRVEVPPNFRDFWEMGDWGMSHI
jgi:hypothetical protein